MVGETEETTSEIAELLKDWQQGDFTMAKHGFFHMINRCYKSLLARVERLIEKVDKFWNG
jgi:hypothetical protein